MIHFIDPAGVMKTAPLPFELGEMSGIFRNKFEHNLVLMQKILVKLLRIEPINKKYVSQLLIVLVEISNCRKLMWYWYTVINPTRNEGLLSNFNIKILEQCDIDETIESLCKDKMFVELQGLNHYSNSL